MFLLPADLRTFKDRSVCTGTSIGPSLWCVRGLAFDDAAKACSDAAAHDLIQTDLAMRDRELLGHEADGLEHRLGAAGGQPGVGMAFQFRIKERCDAARHAVGAVIGGNSDLAADPAEFLLQENVGLRTRSQENKWCGIASGDCPVGAEEHRRAAISTAEKTAWAVGGQFGETMAEGTQDIQGSARRGLGESLSARADGLVNQCHHRSIHIADTERAPQNMTFQLGNLHLDKLSRTGRFGQVAEVNREAMVCPMKAFVGEDWRGKLEHCNEE